MSQPQQILTQNELLEQSKEKKLPLNLQETLIAGRANPEIFITKMLGMPLHDGQREYLRQTQKRKTRINLLTCSNRWGKSTLISCLHLWHLFYKIGVPSGDANAWEKADYRTSNIAPHSALTEPVFKAIDAIMTSRFMYMENGKTRTNDCLIPWFYNPDRTLNTPPYKQFFHNNSYIEHRSLGADQGDSLQGKPYGLITYDEGFRSDHLQNEIDDAILPRLADWQASLHILSTPSQSSHSTLYAYHLYQDGLIGRNQTYTQTGSLRQNSFFNDEQIKAQYDLFKDNPMKDQVLEGKFIFGGDTIFPVADIDAACETSLNDGVRYKEGHKYAIGIDTAIGKDEMVYTVLDITVKPHQLVWMDAVKGNSRSPMMHTNALMNLVDNYRQGSNIEILLETWNGESARFYQDLPPHLQGITRCYGAWQPNKLRTDNDNPNTKKTSPIKKADLLVSLQTALAQQNIKIPANNQKLLEQLQIYREDDVKLQTDRVISLALATWLAEDMARIVQPVWQSVSF